MLKARVPQGIISDICDTLLAEEAALLVETRRFVIELRRRKTSLTDGENRDFYRWAAAQAKELQNRNRRLMHGWRRITGQLME